MDHALLGCRCSLLMQLGQGLGLLDRAQATELARNLLGNPPQDLAALREALPIALRPFVPTVEPSTVGPWRPLLQLRAEQGDGADDDATWLVCRNQVGPRPRVEDLAVLKALGLRRFGTAAMRDDWLAARAEVVVEPGQHLVAVRALLRDARERPCLVSDWLGGRDLASRQARRPPLNEARALRLLRHLCKGLIRLERQGRWHGAITPGNVILIADQRAHLRDDGTAHHHGHGAWLPGIDHLHPARLPWAAPELFDGSAGSWRSDLYALGCLGWWLLCGEPPFRGDVRHLVAQHRGAAREDLRRHAPDTSETTAKLLAKAIAAEPAKRHSSPEALLRSIIRAEEAQVVTVGAPAAAAADNDLDFLLEEPD